MRFARLSPLAALLLALPARPQAAPPAAEPAEKAVASWIAGWFPWGEGETTVEKGTVAVPGWTAWRALKKYTAPSIFEDRVDVLVAPGGATALVGTAFLDEERAAEPAPVAGERDLARLRQFVKERVLGTIHFQILLDPARDLPGFRALKIAIDPGYEGTWTMPAFVSAADGARLFLGRGWRRDRSIAEQRRELIDLSATPSEGPASAKITVVEYSDMQCPMCKRRSAELPALLARLAPELPVRRYVKTYPLTEVHPWSFRAASAGRCFFRKDPALFFSFKANVFARQEQLDVAGMDAFVNDFGIANGMPDVLSSCYLKPENDAPIFRDLGEGFSIGVKSTPSYVVDGVLFVWFDDPLFEEFLRKTYLGGKGLPIRTPAPTPTPKPKG